MKPNGRDTEKQIFFYEADFYPFSNFSAFKLIWERRIFDTSEAAYQWVKFRGEPTVQCKITSAVSAHEAFKRAEKYQSCVRGDWVLKRVGIMKLILRAKVGQHDYVRRKLIASGDRELVEDSWRDPFWGWGPNRDGQNMLGKLWMEIRKEIMEAS